MNDLNITVTLKYNLPEDEAKQLKEVLKEHFKTKNIAVFYGFDKDEIIIINEKTLEISRSNDVNI